MKLRRTIFKGTVTVLTAAWIIAIWTFWFKQVMDPETPPEIIGLFLFTALVITLVTILTWLGLIIGPDINKSNNSNKR